MAGRSWLPNALLCVPVYLDFFGQRSHRCVIVGALLTEALRPDVLGVWELGGRGTAISQEAGVPVPPPPPLRCQVGNTPALNLSPPWPSLWPRESPIPLMAEGCINWDGVYKAPKYTLAIIHIRCIKHGYKWSQFLSRGGRLLAPSGCSDLDVVLRTQRNDLSFRWHGFPMRC